MRLDKYLIGWQHEKGLISYANTDSGMAVWRKSVKKATEFTEAQADCFMRKYANGRVLLIKEPI